MTIQKGFFTGDQSYNTKVAYFSMEFGLHQALKIYSGGLGFLAGSHMRSVYELKQNLIGVGMLWSYGYYDQEREADQSMRAAYTRKTYQFLEDPNITVTVTINHRPVHVKVYLLKAETFQTAPMVLLSTDVESNDHLSRTITSRLYDGNHETRIAQEIVLGVGGVKALEALGEKIDIYHMNEGHAVPLTFKLYEKYRDIHEVKKRVVFTTHTPEAAGNEEHNIDLLHRMGFFSSLDVDTVREITGTKGDMFSLTVGALKLSKRSNAVSKIHAKVGNIFSADLFYTPMPEMFDVLEKYNILGVDMEAAGLYGVAMEYGANALTILTVSDHIRTGEKTSPEERQSTFNEMIYIALDTALES